MSLLGASMLALDGLLCVSTGDCSRVPCGGGVGCCSIDRRCAGSTSLLALIPRVLLDSWGLEVRASSGGHVARLATLLSCCSTGETTTSSGVGIVWSSESRGHKQEVIDYTWVEEK